MVKADLELSPSPDGLIHPLISPPPLPAPGVEPLWLSKRALAPAPKPAPPMVSVEDARFEG